MDERPTWRRGLGVVAAIGAPLLAFGASEYGMGDVLLPEWDDGSAWVWAKLLYAPAVQRWSYPLLAWAMVAYAAAEAGVRARWVEVGLGGGVALAGAYSIVFLPMTPLAAFGAIYLVGLLGFAPYAALAAYGFAYGRVRRGPRRRRSGGRGGSRGARSAPEGPRGPRARWRSCTPPCPPSRPTAGSRRSPRAAWVWARAPCGSPTGRSGR